MPITLYVKKHRVTGLKYFGKTTKPDVEKYPGSGKHWLAHLNTHGNYVDTEIVAIFDDPEQCRTFALAFSEENDIVNSSEWANIIPENGQDGAPEGHAGHVFTDEDRRKISESSKRMWSNSSIREKISAAQKASWTPERREKQSQYGKENTSKQWTEERKLKQSERQKNKPPMRKKGSINSDEHNRKISAGLKGKPKSEEHKKSLSLSRKGKKYPRLIKPMRDHRGNCFKSPRIFGEYYGIGRQFMDDLSKPIRFSSTYDKLGIPYTLENRQKSKAELGFLFEEICS